MGFDDEAAALPVLEFDLLHHEYLWRTFSQWMRDGSCLEIGAFRGEFTSRLVRRFGDVTVIEPSAECANIIRARFARVAVVNEPIETAKPHGKYRNIFLIHTLEHLDDPVAGLKRCRQWLTDDGRLFVAVPNAGAASRLLAVRMGILDSPTDVTDAERRHGHRRTYTQQTLLADAASAELLAKESGGVMFKALSGQQIDQAMSAGIIDRRYLDACYELGKVFPHLCNSTYMVCEATWTRRF